MAQIEDKVIPAHNVPESYERQCIRVKLNGPGGRYPSAQIAKNDIISAAFKKNGGAYQALDETYKITVDPQPGMQIIAYCVMRFVEEPIPQE